MADRRTQSRTRPLLRDRWRYRFDRFMAKGGRSIFLSLTVTFVVLLVMIGGLRALVLTLVDQQAQHDGGILRNLYIVFLQMTDPGNMAQDIASDGGFKTTAVLAGLVGVVMLSTLIAFITTALNSRLGELRKGHSRVVESNHTLILGWNEQRILEILRELIIANESEDDAVVVVLAHQDKEHMDDFLALHLKDRKSTRVVTRSGSPAAPVNLELVAVREAKSVVILAECPDTAPQDDKAGSDARAIKSLLAVVATRGDEATDSVVVELFKKDFHAIARSIDARHIVTLGASEILAKVLVQTSRSVGLSVVYNEMLSFAGAEMYFFRDHWGDRTFGDLSFHFPDGVPVGLREATGEILLNPPHDRVISSSDDLILLATDDSTIELLPDPVCARPSCRPTMRRVERTVERELLVGWTAKAANIVREYAEYVEVGSTIDVMLRSPAPSLRRELADLDSAIPDLGLRVLDRDPMDPATWAGIDPSYYDNILILSQLNEARDMDRIDAETIMILLLIRQSLTRREKDGKVTKLITELVESDNQALATHAGVHDFVISNRYISMLLAQISEERDMHAVYDTLFAEEGSEVYVKPVGLYFDALPRPTTFAEMMAVAQERREVCIGVKQVEAERDARRNFGIQLIPEKSAVFRLVDGDSLVVLAEDET